MTRLWIALVALLLAGCSDRPVPPISAGSTGAESSSPATSGVTGASRAPGGCADTPLWIGPYPAWTASAGVPGGIPYVLSREGNLIAVLFAGSLRAGPNVTDPSNKILWIAREPRGGADLRLTLRRTDGTGVELTQTEPADSGPGEIYPSGVDVPAPGCWQVRASWNGHTATMELNYR